MHIPFAEFHELDGGCTAYCRDGNHALIAFVNEDVPHETIVREYGLIHPDIEIVDMRPAPEAEFRRSVGHMWKAGPNGGAVPVDGFISDNPEYDNFKPYLMIVRLKGQSDASTRVDIEAKTA